PPVGGALDNLDDVSLTLPKDVPGATAARAGVQPQSSFAAAHPADEAVLLKVTEQPPLLVAGQPLFLRQRFRLGHAASRRRCQGIPRIRSTAQQPRTWGPGLRR